MIMLLVLCFPEGKSAFAILQTEVGRDVHCIYVLLLKFIDVFVFETL